MQTARLESQPVPTVTATLNHRLTFLLTLGVVWLLTILAGLGLDREAAYHLVVEHGPVEYATVALYGVVIALLLTWARVRFRYHAALLVFFLVLRELDFHDAFTADSLLTISYHLRGEDPLWIQILAGLVFLLVHVLAIVFLYRLWLARSALWAGRPEAISTLAALALMPLSKVLDSGPRIILNFTGYRTPEELRHWLRLFEETSELAIPLLMILAIVQHTYASRAAAPMR